MQFRQGRLDEIYIVYTRMENSVQADAEMLKLLPLEKSAFNEMKMPLNVHREAIELYPSAEAVLKSNRSQLHYRYDLRLPCGSVCQRAQCPYDGDEVSHRQRAGV